MIDELVKAAETLIEAVQFDDSGSMGRGGNGGLISRETIRKADELRFMVLKYRATSQSNNMPKVTKPWDTQPMRDTET